MAQCMDVDYSQTSHYQLIFITKQERYAVPNTPFSVPGKATTDDLSALVNTLLTESGKSSGVTIEFDFLIKDELLRLPLQQHLEAADVSIETVVEVEYFERYPAPSPEDSLVHDDWVSAVRAAGNWILTGCYDNTLHLYTLSGEHRLTIPGHIAPVKSVSWITVGDPINTFVSTSHDETAMIWQWNQESNSVECIHVCRGHSRSVDCVAVNHSQHKFATGSYDHMLKIWSSDLQMDEDEESDRSSGDGSRKRLKTETGKTINRTPLMTLAGHNEAISGVQWTDSSEIITSSMDRTLRVWDVELGGMKTQLNGTTAFLGISYSPLSHKLVSASTDRFIRLWDPRTKEGSIVKRSFTSHTGWVSSVCWSPSNEYQFASGSYDQMLKLWDTRSPKGPLYDIRGHDDKVLCVDWSSPTHIISGGADNHLMIFNAQEETSRTP